MNSKVFIEELVRRNLIPSSVAEDVLKSSSFSQKNAEDLLAERRAGSDHEIARVKAELLGIPFKKVNDAAVPKDVMSLIPLETVMNYKVVPLERRDNMLIVGMVHPDNEKAQEALRFVARQAKANLGVYLISYGDFDLLARRYAPYEDEIKSALQFVKPTSGGSSSPTRRVVKLEEGVSVSEEAPVIRIVASTFKEAVLAGASDIHIEPQRDRLRIRFRIDGDLKEVSSLPIELHQPVVSRVKVLSDLLIDETRRPQDGRFRTVIMGRDIDFRVSTFPTPAGEKAALRVLDPTVGLRSLSDLGLAGANQTTIDAGLERPFGMILMTGPTGSGKTTTLYALLQKLNKESVNIISLEDPVEYFIDGLNQSQIRHDIGYTFASGLRQVLRQDPDVIMVGEIRDSETAELAVHAALTGHIVLSTLHTNNAAGVIPRLVDMKVDSFLLPAALNLMAAQRLLPRLCDNCKVAEEPTGELGKMVEEEIAKLPPNMLSGIEKPYKIFHAQGCKKCNNKGYLGRIAIFEIFKMTKELADIISTGVNENKILAEAKRQGMVSLREDGIVKALSGIVQMEEVFRETSEI